jgi:hypothetical protein
MARTYTRVGQRDTVARRRRPGTCKKRRARVALSACSHAASMPSACAAGISTSARSPPSGSASASGSGPRPSTRRSAATPSAARSSSACGRRRCGSSATESSGRSCGCRAAFPGAADGRAIALRAELPSPARPLSGRPARAPPAGARSRRSGAKPAASGVGPRLRRDFPLFCGGPQAATGVRYRPVSALDDAIDRSCLGDAIREHARGVT